MSPAEPIDLPIRGVWGVYPPIKPFTKFVIFLNSFVSVALLKSAPNPKPKRALARG